MVTPMIDNRYRLALGARRLRSRRPRQGGFNFAEVLFAVMILGIGFIMVAAIFPVALVQSKLTQEETAGGAVARGGANYMEQIASNARLPVTGGVVRSLDRMPEIQGRLNVASDNRLAWVPFYRRAAGAPYAQLYMIPTAVRSQSTYGSKLPVVVQSALPGTITQSSDYIGNAILTADVYDETAPGNTGRVDYIEFPTGITGNDTTDNYMTVAEGSYVIIANSPELPATGEPQRVGHIFRIGSPMDGQTGAYPRRWNLVPGYDYVPKGGDFDKDGTLTGVAEISGPPVLNRVTVFVVGRSLLNPATGYNPTDNPRDGTGQEVGAYVTFVQIR